MRFKNLPIDFDADGKARLKEGANDPWDVQRAADRRRSESSTSAAAGEGERVVMRTVGSHAFGVVVRRKGGPRTVS